MHVSNLTQIHGDSECQGIQGANFCGSQSLRGSAGCRASIHVIGVARVYGIPTGPPRTQETTDMEPPLEDASGTVLHI